MVLKIEIKGKLPLFIKLGLALMKGYKSTAVNYDTWPNNYTSMANIFTSVEEVEDLVLNFNTDHQVPSWVNGDYYIVAPGKFEWGPTTYRGFLDASGVASKLSVRDGTGLTFNRKFVESATYKTNKAAGDIVVSEMMTYADNGIEGRENMKTKLKRMDYYNEHYTDNTLVNTFDLYEKLFVFGEIPKINILDKVSLETIMSFDINEAPDRPKEIQVLTQTAHGFYDYETNEFYNQAACLYFLPTGIPVPSYVLYKMKNINQDLTREEILNSIEFGEVIFLNEKNEKTGGIVPYMQYFHQAAMTKDYFIMPYSNMEITPVTCTMTQIMNAEAMGDCMGLNENDLDGIFVVYEKASMKELRRFKLNWFVALHLINSFQEGGDKIVMDFMVMNPGSSPFDVFLLETVNATGQQYIDNYNNNLFGTTPARIVLDLNENPGGDGLAKAHMTDMFEDAEDNDEWQTYMKSGSDFPQVKPQDWGVSDYDEFYSNGLGSLTPDRIYYTQISTKTRKVWHEIGYACTELMIINSPDQSECVLLFMASPFEITEKTPTAFVVMLDGKDLTELGRAYFPENVRISWSAHSTWIPQLAPASPEVSTTMIPDEPSTTAAGSNVGTVFSIILLIIGLAY